MRDRVIVQRYAQAFIDFAEPKIGLVHCVKEMKSLKWLLREEKDLAEFIGSPNIPRVDKARVLDTVLKGNYSTEIITFINYLVKKQRVSLLPAIADQVRLKFAHIESVDVVLKTTFPLELDLVTRIKARLEEKLRKKANLYLELDPDLLGGVQVIIGNTVMDGSVRNRLVNLKKKLLQTQVI